jgi:hypothetical protein
LNTQQQPELEEKQEEQTLFQKIIATAHIWGFALIAFLIAAFFFWQKGKKKVYKKELYEPYNVDKKTFSRWIELFCFDILPIEDYSKCRKLPMSLVKKIRDRLGEETEETPVLSKKQIIDRADGSYITLRKSIEKYPDQFGITPSVFKALNCFPPKIAAQILHSYKNGVAKSSVADAS